MGAPAAHVMSAPQINRILSGGDASARCSTSGRASTSVPGTSNVHLSCCSSGSPSVMAVWGNAGNLSTFSKQLSFVLQSRGRRSGRPDGDVEKSRMMVAEGGGGGALAVHFSERIVRRDGISRVGKFGLRRIEGPVISVSSSEFYSEKSHTNRGSQECISMRLTSTEADGSFFSGSGFSWRSRTTGWPQSQVSSRSYRPVNRLKARCMRETGSDDGRVSVSTEEDRNMNDEEAVSHINGQSGALMHDPHENTEANSYLDFGVDENESAENVENSSNGGMVVEETLSRLEETLGAVVVEATEKVVEVASSSIEVVAETVDVAARTVSNVGEIESPLLIEEESVVDKASALKTVAFWVVAAVTFGTLVGFREGTGKASEFFAGYLLEQSLSVDNLFVFVLIFNYFKVPFPYQSRVLTYGIAGAVVFRAVMIGLGIASLQKFEGLNLLFAAILVFSSFKLVSGGDGGEEDLSDNFIVNLCRKFIPVTSTYDGNNFLTTVGGVKKATPLLLTLVVVELSDIAFAVDSIPAVFGVTRDPLIVYSSNIFAILGLRSLYTIISGNMGELEYLQPSVGIVLGFIGAKMIGEFFGLHVPTEVSLGVVAVVLGAGVGLSLLERSKDRND